MTIVSDYSILYLTLSYKAHIRQWPMLLMLAAAVARDCLLVPGPQLSLSHQPVIMSMEI